MPALPRCLVLGSLVTTLVACGSDASLGKGTLAFTTYGEDYIEREIPSADVEDGWTIRFDSFLVSIGELTVGEPNAEPALRMPNAMLVSMKTPGDKPLITFQEVPAKAYTKVSYAISPVTEQTSLGPGASADDKARMTRDGHAMYVAGSLTRGSEKKSFAWGFSSRTRYADCKASVGGKDTEGVVVTNGSSDSVQLTIHGDHLFYDDLVNPEAKLRVDAIASADADGDGAITLAELSAVKLASLPSSFGPYGTGSAGGVHDLRAFLEALSRTVGHFRGEGECVPTRD